MTLERMLRYVVIIGVFFIPFIPFIVSPSMFFPFITGKNFTFRIVTEIIVAAWAVLAVLSPAYRPKKSAILWGLASLVAIMAIANVFSPNSFKAFWSNFERMEGWVTLIHLFGYFVAVSSVLTAEKLWVRLAGVTTAASVFMGLYGLLQLAGKLEIHQSGTRLDATLGNATYLAVYMIFHVFITALLIAYARARNMQWMQWVLGLILFLQVVIIFFTETRGAMLGLVGGALLGLLVYAVSAGGKSRTIAFGGLAALALLVGGFVLVRDASWMPETGPLNRLSTISLEAGDVRFMVWNMAVQGVTESPKTIAIGTGQESFNYIFNEYYDPGMYAQEPWFDRAHNVFMDWLVAGGFLGLIAYLSLFGAALYYLWFFRREGVSPFSVAERAIITGLLAAYFFHNIFVFDNLVSYIFFVTFLAYLHVRAVGDVAPHTAVDHVREGHALRFAAPVALVLLVAAIYFVNVKGIVTARTLLQAMSPHPEEGIPKNLEFFKEAYAGAGVGAQEVAEQFVMASYQVQGTELPAGQKQEFINASIAAMEEELVKTPDDARLLVFMTTLHNVLGDREKALEYGLRALAQSPNKQYTLLEVSNVYAAMQQYDKALELAKKAYELEPAYRDAAIYYAAVLSLAGHDAEADALLEQYGGAAAVNDNRLLNAYVQAGRHDEVVKIWERRAVDAPEDPQIHVSLAAAYFNAGRKEDAIRALQKAAELNPEFKAAAEHYISEIRAGRNP